MAAASGSQESCKSFSLEKLEDSPCFDTRELSCEVLGMEYVLRKNKRDIEEQISKYQLNYGSSNRIIRETFWTNEEEYVHSLKDVREGLLKFFHYNFDTYIDFITPHITVPASSDVVYQYLMGDSPWDFTLISNNNSAVIKIHHEIKKLKNFKNIKPLVGEVVLCQIKNYSFRGINLQILHNLKNRLYKILDIDRGFFYTAYEENVFALPEYLQNYPPLTIRCTLFKDPMDAGCWTTALRNYFVEQIRENKFTIIIKDKMLLQNPPKYLIELNNEKKVNSDFYIWLTKLIIPTIKSCTCTIESIEEDLLELEMPDSDFDDDTNHPSTKTLCEVTGMILFLLDKLNNIIEISHRIKMFAIQRKLEPMFMFRFRKCLHLFSSKVRFSSEYCEKLYYEFFTKFDYNMSRKLCCIPHSISNFTFDAVYKYVSGDDPWDFFICRIDSIVNLEIKAYVDRYFSVRRSNLSGFPKSGRMCLCKVSNCIFRGICAGVDLNQKVRVYNLDVGVFEKVERNNLYDIPLYLLNIPPLSVRCSLSKNSIGKHKWNKNLTIEFKELFMRSYIKVEIISLIESKIPFKYYINNLKLQFIDGTNDTEWFNYTISPELLSKSDFKDDEELLGTVGDDVVVNYNPSSTNDEVPVCKFSEIYDKAHKIVTNGPLPTYDDIVDEVRDYYDDEVPVCKFPDLGGGKCWKSDCTREHIQNKGPSYIGSLYSYCKCFREQELPSVGEVIYLELTTIINKHTFYANVIKAEKEFQMTLALLNKRINNFAEVHRYSLLDGIPCLGELVMAPVSSNRNYWCRARIVDVDDTKSEIFYLDYGFKRWANNIELRKIKYDFLTLPPQAIRCRISNIVEIDTDKLTVADIVCGVVLIKDECNLELEVELQKKKNNTKKDTKTKKH